MKCREEIGTLPGNVYSSSVLGVDSATYQGMGKENYKESSKSTNTRRCCGTEYARG